MIIFGGTWPKLKSVLINMYLNRYRVYSIDLSEYEHEKFENNLKYTHVYADNCTHSGQLKKWSNDIFQ